MTTQQDDIKALREALEGVKNPYNDASDDPPATRAFMRAGAQRNAERHFVAACSPDRIARLLDELEAARAKAMPDDDDIEWPDVDDMAHSAVQEAYAFGVSHDVFKRHMLSVMFKTAGAIRAAIASKEST